MRNFRTVCLTTLAFAALATSSEVVDANPDGGCWTTSQPYGCCLLYPGLNQTVECNGATCLPAYSPYNEETHHLTNVVSGWLLSSMEHTDTDPRCWIQVALCDYTHNPPISQFRTLWKRRRARATRKKRG